MKYEVEFQHGDTAYSVEYYPTLDYQPQMIRIFTWDNDEVLEADHTLRRAAFRAAERDIADRQNDGGVDHRGKMTKEWRE